jgi:hypothetical protein
MKMNRWLVMAGVAAMMGLGSTSLMAQNGGGNGGGNGGQNWRNMTPEQRQQARLDLLKERLEVKDDAEWSAIRPLVQKVEDARRAIGFGGGRGMFPGRGRGGPGGDQGGQGGPGGGQRGGFAPQSNPEADALQKAIESKASKAELKAALDKFTASRKAKQAALEQAQDNLRKVLTSRQEAIATADGLL